MAMKPIPDIFKKKPPAMESKGDTTTRIAQEIIKQDAVAAAAKLERLRAARLAQETEARAAAPEPAKKKRGKS